jgi:hypothetical protein
MIRGSDARLRQVLVLLKPSGRNYVAETLAPPGETAVASVIRRVPPGTYSDAEQGRSVRTRFDAVVLEKLEAAGTLFYRTRNGFRRLDISE